MPNPPFSENSQLVASWIRLQYTVEDSPEYEAEFWSFEMMYFMVSDEPEKAWPVILEILATDNSTTILENLSAGPLEDLMAEHGSAFIERIEEEARRNPKFSRLLGGVWKSSITDDIWSRVQAVWDRRGWDGIPLESP